MEANEKPRISRLTAIITQLQSTTLVTAKMLADRHQVSVRTIYRDIRTLEQSGVPIVTEEGRGYSLMDGYHLPPIMLSENEANALITAEKLVLKNKDASFVKHYTEAIQKIKTTLRKPQKEKSNLLADRVYVLDNFNSLRTSDYLMLLQSAITNFEVLDIEYHSLQKNQTSRSIEPFALYSSQEKWLLIAFCKLRKAFRVFRIDHITAINRTQTHFESHNMTLEEYYKRYIHK